MRFLIDTHALLWWWGEPELLSERARNLIAQPENSIVASAASAWEIAIKARLGKLPQATEAATRFSEWTAADGFEPLPITAEHALRAGALIGTHRDPFDRMLAAQSMLEGIEVITRDAAIAGLGARTVW